MGGCGASIAANERAGGAGGGQEWSAGGGAQPFGSLAGERAGGLLDMCRAAVGIKTAGSIIAGDMVTVDAQRCDDTAVVMVNAQGCETQQ